MHKHNKLDEIALKNLIRIYISPTDCNNRIKFIVCYPKFNTTNLAIYTNFSSSTSYHFKYPLEKCLFNKVNNNIGLTDLTL